MARRAKSSLDRAAFGLGGLLFGMSLQGCGTPPPPEPLGVGALAWPFRPVQMAFHPLSRADSRDAETSLLLRIDFMDADGDPVKAIGTLEVAIEAATAVPASNSWSFDLTDPIENRSLFDPVTLAYRIRLESPWEQPPRPGDPIRLRGRLDCGDGHFDAVADVVW